MTAERIERMHARLSEALDTDDIQIADEGHKHIGHAGAASGLGHFNVRIRSPLFAGKSVLERHRLVYEALGEMMQTDIHAVSIRALADSE